MGKKIRSSSSPLSGPVLITIVYFIFGFLWILFSDRFAAAAVSPEYFIKLQTYKGWLYVVITSGLIYALVRIYKKKKDELLADLQKTVVEKNHLLDEVHHRVRNNLQFIISILKLRQADASTEECKKLTVEITDVLFSISSLHENLYKTNISSEVHFQNYVETVCTQLQDRLSKSGIPVSFSYTGSFPHLPIELATPCGIIVTELIRSVSEHTLYENREVSLSIGFDTAADNNYRLTIRNNIQSESISIQHLISDNSLVQLLTEQIGGSLGIEVNRNVVQIILQFPACPPGEKQRIV